MISLAFYNLTASENRKDQAEISAVNGEPFLTLKSLKRESVAL